MSPATVYLDGRFLPASRARVSVTDPSLTPGEGLFETLRTHRGRPFRLRDHAERLRNSARRLGWNCRWPDVERILPTLLRRNRLLDARIRITCSAGGSRWITAQPGIPLPPRSGSAGVKLRTAPWRVDPRAPLRCHKTTGRSELRVARELAAKRGAFDMLLPGMEDEILEGTRANVFLVIRRRLVTPDRGVLPGVTRKTVLELASALRIPAETRTVRMRELATATEVFVTNALVGIVPVRAVDDLSFGPPGPVTRRLAEAYRDAVDRECRQRTE